MKTIRGAAAALLISTLALTACTGTPALEVTTNAPAVEATPTPSETPSQAAPAAERGTRSNPLAVGESRQIVEDSMWTVGATAATEVRDGFLVLPLRLQMDWETTRANTVAGGGDPADVDNLGINPFGAVNVTFVSASGRSYTSFDQYEAETPSPQIWEVGTLFPPAESVDVFIPVSVPAEDVAGGVWQVANYAGDSVYLAP